MDGELVSSVAATKKNTTEEIDNKEDSPESKEKGEKEEEEEKEESGRRVTTRHEGKDTKTRGDKTNPIT